MLKKLIILSILFLSLILQLTHAKAEVTLESKNLTSNEDIGIWCDIFAKSIIKYFERTRETNEIMVRVYLEELDLHGYFNSRSAERFQNFMQNTNPTKQNLLYYMWSSIYNVSLETIKDIGFPKFLKRINLLMYQLTK
jgi:hypothetical protein